MPDLAAGDGIRLTVQSPNILRISADFDAEALATSGQIYPDTTAGIAATTDGEYFYVADTVAGTLALYRNVSEVATSQNITVATTAGVVDLLDGGANVSDTMLKEWTAGEDYEVTAQTIDSTTGLPTTATVKWPDGSAGTFTPTTVNSTFNKIDAFTISHTASGKTVTQAAVTRNSNGAVTSKPALTVA